MDHPCSTGKKKTFTRRVMALIIVMINFNLASLITFLIKNLCAPAN